MELGSVRIVLCEVADIFFVSVSCDMVWSLRIWESANTELVPCSIPLTPALPESCATDHFRIISYQLEFLILRDELGSSGNLKMRCL
jgi:hypothetical protein